MRLNPHLSERGGGPRVVGQQPAPGWGGMRRRRLRAPEFMQEPLQIGTCCEGGFLCLYSHR